MSQAQGQDRVPSLPAAVPRMPRNAFAQWLARSLLRSGGWTLVGEFPDLPKAVLIAAPHSSNWDGIWGFAAKVAVGIRLSVLGKHSLFRIPVLAQVLRWQGVIPVDRAMPLGVIEQAIATIRAHEAIWYAIAPEGTRRRVPHWKTGFWKIAHGAGVPVVPAAFDYPNRRIVIGAALALTDDMEADIARIQRWYAPFHGRNHDVRQPD
ncbi:lysophospholipid acyltransferase family protein [Thermomonas sp.]|uniref:lysophospholipid acyltransferase family protein n=1 Tax=Thermomonas sp. TaxID=1971895 RepID=UPI0031F312E2